MSKAAEKFLTEEVKEFKKIVLTFEKLGYFTGTGAGMFAIAFVIALHTKEASDFAYIGLALGIFLMAFGLSLHKKGNSGDEA